MGVDKFHNDKVQSSNEIQMTKCQTERSQILAFGIDLKFACLPVGRNFDI